MAVTEVTREGYQPAEAPRRSGLVSWLTTTDHKRIGILYIGTAFFFFLVGGLLAEMIRTQLWSPDNTLFNFHRYNQLFTVHAITMIFLFVMPITVGFANFIVPLQIGAADMAFPRVNAFSYWLFPLGGLMIYGGFLSPQGAASPGWTLYEPLTGVQTAGSAPGFGTDLMVMGLLVLGLSSLLGAINFLVTIFKLRAPGMTMFRLPIFVRNVHTKMGSRNMVMPGARSLKMVTRKLMAPSSDDSPRTSSPMTMRSVPNPGADPAVWTPVSGSYRVQPVEAAPCGDRNPP